MGGEGVVVVKMAKTPAGQAGHRVGAATPSQGPLEDHPPTVKISRLDIC